MVSWFIGLLVYQFDWLIVLLVRWLICVLLYSFTHLMAGLLVYWFTSLLPYCVIGLIFMIRLLGCL